MEGYVPGRQLANAPLVYTVALVRIQLQKMAEYIPNIQDALRDLYPGFAEFHIQQVEMHPGPKGLAAQSIEAKYWALRSERADKGIVLANDRIIIHTRTYTRFADFGEEVKEALKRIRHITKISHHQGLAFRQVDNVFPQNGAPIENIIRSEFLSPKLASRELSSATHGTRTGFYDTKEGVFRMSASHHTKGPVLVVPDDLIPLWNMLSPSNDMQREGPIVVLDFDHHQPDSATSRAFTVDSIVDEFNRLHRYCSSAFRDVLDPTTYKEWKSA